MNTLPHATQTRAWWAGAPAGFSMLEAMAALMVLNLLALGLLFGQFQALQAQRDALATHNAVELAQDLWHRMQVNPQGWMHYQWQGNTAPSAPDCQSMACNGAEWAQADIGAWWREVQGRIPGAQVRVSTTAMPAPQVRVQLQWPVADAANSQPAQALSDCPAQWRCWESTWRP